MQRRKILKKSLAYIFLFSFVPSIANVHKEKKMNVQLIITFHIKKEKLSSFMEVIKEVKNNLPQVDGCSAVVVFQSNEDKQIFTFIETWENIEKHKKHIKHVIDSGDWEYISSHLIDEPKSQYYHEV